jgi:hypothetical protein
MCTASSNESSPLLAAVVSIAANSNCNNDAFPHQVAYKTDQVYVAIFLFMQCHQKKLLVVPEGTRKPHGQSM